MENGVEAGQETQPLVPPFDIPVYPEAQLVHTEKPVPMVPVPAVLYPVLQDMQPEVGTAPLLEYVPWGHLLHTKESLPCVPELAVDLPVGQALQPPAVAAVVELLYVPTGHGKQISYPIPEYLPATHSEHMALDVAPVAL